MKQSIIILTIGSLFFACNKVNFAPVKGEIEGIIVNNLNQPVEEATITAHFIKPSNNGEGSERTITKESDSNGYYHFEDLFDEVQIEVRADDEKLSGEIKTIDLGSEGFNQQLNFKLEGVPELLDFYADSTSLSLQSPFGDQITLVVHFQDFYNSFNNTNYTITILMENDLGAIVHSFSNFTPKVLAQTNFVFERTLHVSDLPQNISPGNYNLKPEIVDADGNLFEASEQLLLVLE